MRRRPLRFLLGALAILTLGVWAWVWSLERELRGKVERRVAELENGLRTRNPARPLLSGDPLPGDAWEDYVQALDALAPLSSAARYNLYERKTPLTAAEEATVATVLAAVRQGSRRGEARLFLDFVPTVDRSIGPAPRHNQTGSAGTLVGREARRRFEAGQPREGTELLIAALQLGRDAAAHPDWMGWRCGSGILSGCLRDAQAAFQAGLVPAEDAAAIERALGGLDDGRDGIDDDVTRDLLHWGKRVLDGLPGENHSRLRPWPGWRQAFSWRVMELQGFLILDGAIRTRNELLTESYAGERLGWDELEKDVKRRNNQAAYDILWGACPSGRVHRETWVQLRLIRIAAHHAATGELLPLQDPMGRGAFASAARNGELHVWSAWRNGIDDGGTEAKDLDKLLRLPLRKP